MKKILIFSVLMTFVYQSFSQTVIEMLHPADANVVLLEVGSKEDADIVIYKTEDKKEAQEWNCKWKFKDWGFSNFSIYISQTESDSLLYDTETGNKLIIHGKVFFTDNSSECGYMDLNFRLEGVLRKISKSELITPEEDESDDEDDS